MGRFSKKLARALRGEQKGFTLIELLIVVAILGILAAVIIPNVSSFMVTGRINAANTEVENVKTAVLACYAEHGVYPPSTTSANMTGFISGTLFSDYNISTQYGWVLTAVTTPKSGVRFEPGVDTMVGNSGKWVRN
jgi:prepilin-type N-terminal cleavage/methylation domain-containing protein